jgi:hypothetical protein
LLVVDIDVSKDDRSPTGLQTLTELETDIGQRLPAHTFTTTTPSGGQHRYFRLTAAQARLPLTTTGRLGPGLDTRAKGGYVVAPPTSLGMAGRYRVVCDYPPAPAPTWLIDRLLTSDFANSTPGRIVRSASVVDNADRYVAAAINGETERIVGAPVGQRNQTLFLASIALGQLVGGGMLDEDQATAALHRAARSQHEVPGDGYDRRQATATIRSGIDRGRRRPRTLRRRG